MSMQWTIQDGRDDHEHGRVVVLSGSITETADFQPLAALAGSDTLRLDLAGIEQINSCGVREWIHFVSNLTKTAHPFDLERCSPAIVRQLNMISNFRGGGRVKSVMLPYYCAECGYEERRLLDLSAPGARPLIEEVLRCPSCGGSAEFDDLPSTYMSFTT